jgi:hypothetical protein
LRLIVLVASACVFSTQSFATDIVLRCEGELSEIWIPSTSGEEVTIDTSSPSTTLPKSLSEHPRFHKSKVNRIVRVKPGYMIDTNALGSPGAPRDVDMRISYCKEENRALYCKRDRASDDRQFWEHFHITIIPPWSVEVREVWFGPKRSNGKIIKRDGFMLSDSYNYSQFSSMNCEQIDPIPALDKIMR